MLEGTLPHFFVSWRVSRTRLPGNESKRLMVPKLPAREERRRFLQATGLGVALPASAAISARIFAKDATVPSHRVPELAGAIGIVTASSQAQLTGRAKGRNFTLLELPSILREELGLRVIDLNTSSIPNFELVKNAYLDRLRSVVEQAGCTLTNLKMNQRGLDMNSRDKAVRQRALAEYKRAIDITSRLGCRWARPLPGKTKPDLAIHVAGYRELCDYAVERNVKLLVENFGWMQSDPNSVVQLLRAIGPDAAAGVDIGNWANDQVRYDGLAATFPFAATCDFKARQLGPNGEHASYDLRRCFQLAWNSGFRGPWCLEHANVDTKQLLHELGLLCDRLRRWSREAGETDQQ